MTDYDAEADRTSDQIDAWWAEHRGRPISTADAQELRRLIDYFDAAVETGMANLRRARETYNDLMRAVERRAVSDNVEGPTTFSSTAAETVSTYRRYGGDSSYSRSAAFRPGTSFPSGRMGPLGKVTETFRNKYRETSRALDRIPPTPAMSPAPIKVRDLAPRPPNPFPKVPPHIPGLSETDEREVQAILKRREGSRWQSGHPYEQ